MDNVVEVIDLKKSYGDNQVLKGISFKARKGEILGILGINGAGKTTALECMEGTLKYDQGKVVINGKMGVQLQLAALPAYLKVNEAIKLFSKWKKAKLENKFIKALKIDELNNKQYLELSMGQKRRLHLALSLIGNPDILFLDEPAAGLDVAGKMALHEIIKELKNQGKTIILSSHDLNEVEHLCDRIVVLHQGKIIFDGTAKNLATLVNKRCKIKIITETKEDEYLTDDIASSMLSILTNYQKLNQKILDIKIDHGSLEADFIKLTKEVTI